jgi:hypothetical protein
MTIDSPRLRATFPTASVCSRILMAFILAARPADAAREMETGAPDPGDAGTDDAGPWDRDPPASPHGWREHDDGP